MLVAGAALARRLARASGEDDEDTDPPHGYLVDDPVWDVGWLDGLRDVPPDAIWPRFMTVPHPDAQGSYGERFEAWALAEFGVELRWFQRLVAYRLLEHDAAGHLCWGVLILTMARQLGKSMLLAALLAWRLVEGAGMFGEPQVLLHVGRDTAVAREVQLRARLWAMARGSEFKVIESNGKEMVQHNPSGSRWIVRAEKAVYGWSATSALVDECWDVKVRTVKDGIVRTMVAHQDSQLLLTSTARGGEDATPLFPNYRSANVHTLGAPKRDLFIEWSAPASAGMRDRAAWRMASPFWDQAREDAIAEAVDEAEFVGDPDAVEAIRSQDFNIWPARLSVGRGETLVAPQAWDALTDADAVGPLVLAVDDYVGLGAAACAAGFAEDGRLVVGGWCFGSRAEAYGWVSSYAAGSPGSVLLVGRLLDGDVELGDVLVAEQVTMGGADTRAGLSLVRELVGDGRLAHDGSSDLRGQVLGARVTPAAGGGLSLVNEGRQDLLRCLVWAVGRAHRDALVAPAVL